MANSSIITDMKAKVISEIINDETLFYAINSPIVTDIKHADELVNTHVFRYHQNPDTLDKAITFITVQVHTLKQNRYDDTNLWIRPTLELWIVSHETCMNVNNIPKIPHSRNDYIAQLLDNKFNGRTILGIDTDPNKLHLIGKLDLIENTEGAFAVKYLYRRLVFITRDINDSLCEMDV